MQRVKVRCSRCKLFLTTEQHYKFRHLDPSVYRHPLDIEGMKQLDAQVGIQKLVDKMLLLAEQSYGEAFFAANGLRVSAQQYPALHAKLVAACDTMGITRVPGLYLSFVNLFGEMGHNTFSAGVDQPFIVMSPELLEQLTERDMVNALAKELGHIHCGHMRYKLAADFLCLVLDKAFKRTHKQLDAVSESVSIPMQKMLITWRIAANLSADRTAILVSQQEKCHFEYLMREAGGTQASNANFDAFVQQANKLNLSYMNQWLEDYWQQILYARRSFNFPVWRASEMILWLQENQKGYGYRDIVKIFSA